MKYNNKRFAAIPHEFQCDSGKKDETADADEEGRLQQSPPLSDKSFKRRAARQVQQVRERALRESDKIRWQLPAPSNDESFKRRAAKRIQQVRERVLRESDKAGTAAGTAVYCIPEHASSGNIEEMPQRRKCRFSTNIQQRQQDETQRRGQEQDHYHQNQEEEREPDDKNIAEIGQRRKVKFSQDGSSHLHGESVTHMMHDDSEFSASNYTASMEIEITPTIGKTPHKSSDQRTRRSSSKFVCLKCLLLLLLVIGIIVSVFAGKMVRNKKHALRLSNISILDDNGDAVLLTQQGNMTLSIGNNSTGITNTNQPFFDVFERYLPEYTKEALMNPKSPQSMALEWIKNNPNKESLSYSQTIQKFALATLWYCTTPFTATTASTNIVTTINTTQYNESNGINIEISPWKQSMNWMTYTMNECDWFFSRHRKKPSLKPCSEDGSTYDSLLLFSNNLQGQVPAELSLLSSLRRIELFDNALSGTLPTEIGMLDQLESLDLSQNEISGTLPEEIGNAAAHLISVRLNNNKLYGIIPLESLGGQQAEDNSGILRSSKLEEFRVSNNFFNGSITTNVGVLTNLRILDLSNNLIHGTIPMELSESTLLTTLKLHSNQISGSIAPKILSSLHRLQNLHLNDNQLNGTLPGREFAMLSDHLLRLQLDNNHISGTIHQNLGRLDRVLEIQLSYNCISGSIPKQLGELSTLKNLILNNNRMTGTIPVTLFDNMVDLHELYLNHNKFNGTLPSQIAYLDSSLRKLHLHHNQFTGSIPMYALNKLMNLRELYLDSNQFNGTLIGAAYGTSMMTNLQNLRLSNNHLTGPLPTGLGKLLSSIKTLHLNSNQFTGTIPSELGLLTNLSELYLFNNSLTGTVPEQVCQLIKKQQSPFSSIEKMVQRRIIPQIIIDCATISCSCDCVCR